MRVALSISLFLTAATLLQAAPFVVPREEDLRILEMRLDNEVLTDEIAAYQRTGGGVMLPLGEVARLLGLGITVKPEDGSAQGFVVHETRTFFLDLGRHEVTLSGKPAGFDPDLVQLQQADVYVDSTLLSQWLQIDLDIDLFTLRVTVRPREPLPMQLRRSRERRIEQSRRGQRTVDPGFPRWQNPYDLFALPFIDQSFRLSYLSGAIDEAYTTYATGDLFGLQSEWYVHGDRTQPVQDARLTLGRKDPDAGLLGLLRAREFAAGYVSQPGSSLVSASRSPAPGVLISSYPLDRPTQFSSHSFYGSLPPGWDVELYQNDALINYQTARADGLYAFEDVPLLFGSNFFQLVFYGPQGQRRVENHQFVIGASLTKPGAVYYRVVANQEPAGSGPTVLDPTALVTGHGFRALAQTDIGVLKWLSAAGEMATVPLPGGQHDYAKVGLRAYLGALFAYADLVRDQKGGSAGDLGFQTRVLGIGVTGTHSGVTQGYVSEVFPLSADPVSRRDMLRFDAAIPASILPRITITFEADQDLLMSGHTHTKLRYRIATSYRGFLAANELRWDREIGTDPSFEGTFQLSRTVRGHSLRGEVIYELGKQTRLSTVNLSADGFLTPHYRYTVSVARSQLAGDERIALGVNKLFGTFAAGVQAQFNSRGNLGVSLDLSVGLGYDPRKSRMVADARPAAAFGAASVRSFLDSNLNGKLDPGEEPIEHVAFSINGNQSATVTDKGGVALLTQLPVYRPLDLGLAVGSLEDPSWVPELKGIRFTSRPGKTIKVDFPVVLTGEVDGTARVERLGTMTPAGGVSLQLADSSGRVRQETKAAYDGYFLFTAVVPGEYDLRIDPADVARLALVNPPKRTVKIGADGTVVNGVDLALRMSAEESQIVAKVEMPPSPTAPIAPAEPLAATSSTTPRPLPTPAPAVNSDVGRAVYYNVQVGAYRLPANADNMLRKIQVLGFSGSVTRNGSFRVVRAGPFSTLAAAVSAMRALARHGISGAVISTRGRISASMW